MNSHTRRSSSHFQLFLAPEEDLNANDGTASTTRPAPALDFVRLFPPELSVKLFGFLAVKDVTTCCQVSIGWRHVLNNNSHWMNRCKDLGLFHGGGVDNADPFKWTDSPTHVDTVTLVCKNRTSPAFLLPPIASTRLSSLCPWGRYFRQCLHLRHNWTYGTNIIHQMNFPKNKKPLEICTCAHSHKSVLAMGANSGSVYLWSTAGVPKLRQTLTHSSVVEQVLVGTHILAVLYQDGSIQSYRIPQAFSCSKSKSLEPLFMSKVWALPTPNIQNEYTLFSQCSDPTVVNVENESDYLAADFIFLLTEVLLLVSGYASNSFLVFGLETKDSKKVQLPQGVQACRNAFVSSSVIYLTAKRRRLNQRFDSSVSIFLYELEEPWEFTEFRNPHLTEEIRIDPANNPDKVVWIAQDSIIYAAHLNTKELFFTRTSEAYVDSLVVHRDFIVYHQYDGYITALNWTGQVLYVTAASPGISRGFQSSSEFLVTASDSERLSVYRLATGKLLHKVMHQPARVEHLFVHDTKIICIGRDEPPVLIGYW